MADDNLLFRSFVGLTMDDPVWDATVLTKNRERLLADEVARAFLEQILLRPAPAPSTTRRCAHRGYALSQRARMPHRGDFRMARDRRPVNPDERTTKGRRLSQMLARAQVEEALIESKLPCCSASIFWH